MSGTKKRLVVLASGNGSNLQAIIDACESKHLDASVAAVISNTQEAFALVRAKKHGIYTEILKPDGLSRKHYDSLLAKRVATYQPDLVVLAGWMRLLSMNFLGCFPKQVINLHPALAGQFPGLNAIERAFEAFQHKELTHSGVMVHFVPDEGVDNGPVILEEKVAMVTGETFETFKKRMHTCEHQILIRAIAKALNANP